MGLRAALIDLAFRLRVSPWTLRAIDRFGTVILGLLWLIFVMASEGYFDDVLRHRRRGARLARIFIIELGVLGVAHGAHLLMT